MRPYVFDKTKRRYCYLREGGRCFYCGKPLSFGGGTLDHHLPRARGGPSAVYNLVLCCRACNREKGDAVPPDWEGTVCALFSRAVGDGALPLPPGEGRRLPPAVAQGVAGVRPWSEGLCFFGPAFTAWCDGHRVTKVRYPPPRRGEKRPPDTPAGGGRTEWEEDN